MTHLSLHHHQEWIVRNPSRQRKSWFTIADIATRRRSPTGTSSIDVYCSFGQGISCRWKFFKKKRKAPNGILKLLIRTSPKESWRLFRPTLREGSISQGGPNRRTTVQSSQADKSCITYFQSSKSISLRSTKWTRVISRLYNDNLKMFNQAWEETLLVLGGDLDEHVLENLCEWQVEKVYIHEERFDVLSARHCSREASGG